MQAVILAGGAGTRLYPLTADVPKPMILINGKPFLLYLVEYLRGYGIKDFVFCTGYLPEKFSEFFGNGEKFGVKIDYSVEKEFLGTGGALKLAEPFLGDDFLVLNGDTYLPIDYSQLYKEFKRMNKLAMLVAYDNRENAAEANTAVAQGLVTAYNKREPLKKGDQPHPLNPPLHRRWIGGNPNEVREGVRFDYVDAGAYVFKREILSLIAKNTFVALEADIYPELIKTKELAAFVTNQRYYDMGTPERLELVKQVLK
jgi:NDP-sugar pyrophosphorylase family protein